MGEADKSPASPALGQQRLRSRQGLATAAGNRGARRRTTSPRRRPRRSLEEKELDRLITPSSLKEAAFGEGTDPPRGLKEVMLGVEADPHPHLRVRLGPSHWGVAKTSGCGVSYEPAVGGDSRRLR